MTTPHTELVRVETRRLVLREYRVDDLADLRAAFVDEQMARWSPGPPDEAGLAEYLAGRNDWSAADHASWAVADGSDRLVGSVSLHKLDLGKGDSEVGYWVAPWARGRGYAVEAVRAATGFAFTQLGLHRVFLYHAVENLGSCAVADSAGFLLEGTLRQSFRYGDGRFHDEHLHGLLASDLS